jgi:hypothetical protein
LCSVARLDPGVFSADEISIAELVDAGLFVCSDVAMIGVCALPD